MTAIVLASSYLHGLITARLIESDRYNTAVRQVREHEVLRGVPVVAMTGRDAAASRDRAEDMGFNQYLSKPLDFLRLSVVIEILIGGTPAKPPARL
jgi:CheY-like chemotaxis protein